MRHFFTSLLLLAGIINANAQFSDTYIIDQCRPCNTKDIQSADFENDGFRDLIIIGFAKGEVATARNAGDETFAEPEVFLEGSFSYTPHILAISTMTALPLIHLLAIIYFCFEDTKKPL